MVKKALSFILTVGMLASVSIPTTFAKVGPVRLQAADDFESYTVTETGSEFTGKGTVINENWSTSSVNAGYNDGMKVSIAQDSADETKKVLGIRGAGDSDIAAVNYTGDRSEIVGDAVMEADITLLSWNGTAGVRFMVSEDEKSYYQLLIAEGKDTLLQKYVNGTQQGESVVVHSGWGQARTSHVKMEMKDSKLTCYYTLNGDVYTGVIEDSAPLTAQGNATTCSFIMKSDTTSYFDNFQYYCEKMDYDDSIDVVLTDDFEGYSITETPITGNSSDKAISENWVLSSKYKGGNSEGTAAIAANYANSEGKSLKMTGKWNNTYDAICVNYVGDRSDIVGDAALETDIYYTGGDNGRIGVRFMVSADEKSYYQFITNNYGHSPILKQIVNGSEVKSVDFGDWWGFAGKLFHIKMELKNGILTATATKDGETKSCVIDDQTPLTANGNETTYAMVVIGDGTEAYFDNFKLTGTKEKHYSVNTNASISDDFETHTETEDLSGKGTNIAAGWAISSKYAGWQEGLKAAIVPDLKNPTKKVLKMVSKGNVTNAVNYIGDRSKIVGNKVAFETDMYYTADASKAGVRFLTQNNEQTYYQILFSDWGGAPTLTKVIDGELIESASFTPDLGSQNQIFNKNRKNHIKIELDGNDLTATVTNSGTVYTASLTVGTEIVADGNNTTCQFVTNGDSATAYFDNFKYYCGDTFIISESEPSDVMYVDVFANKKVQTADNAEAINNGNDVNASTIYTGKQYIADLGEAKIIRKVVLVNPTVASKVRIITSVDGNDWEYLGSIKSDESEFVNLYTNVPFRYVQLLSDDTFSFGDVRILTDSESNIFAARRYTNLYLYPRVDGVNLETPVWTYSNAGFVSVEGNKATPMTVPADGTIIVTANDKVSAEIKVLPTYNAVKNDDGTVTFNMGFNYYTDSTKLFAVYYDVDGRVISVSDITPTYETNTNLDEISLTITPPETYYSAKLMCWDGGFTKMISVVEAMEF